jgi:hypothetical protein
MRGVGKTACTSFAACCSIERGAVRILSLWIGTLGRELITVGNGRGICLAACREFSPAGGLLYLGVYIFRNRLQSCPRVNIDW